MQRFFDAPIWFFPKSTFHFRRKSFLRLLKVYLAKVKDSLRSRAKNVFLIWCKECKKVALFLATLEPFLLFFFPHYFVFVAPADSVSLQNHCWHKTVQNNKENKYVGKLALPLAVQQFKYTEQQLCVHLAKVHLTKTRHYFLSHRHTYFSLNINHAK